MCCVLLISSGVQKIHRDKERDRSVEHVLKNKYTVTYDSRSPSQQKHYLYQNYPLKRLSSFSPWDEQNALLKSFFHRTAKELESSKDFLVCSSPSPMIPICNFLFCVTRTGTLAHIHLPINTFQNSNPPPPSLVLDYATVVIVFVFEFILYYSTVSESRSA